MGYRPVKSHGEPETIDAMINHPGVKRWSAALIASSSYLFSVHPRVGITNELAR